MKMKGVIENIESIEELENLIEFIQKEYIEITEKMGK